MTNLHYWDSCAFLAWLQNESAHEAACRDTIEQAKSGEIVLVTSALTIAEVLWTKNGPRLEEDKATILNKFFRRSYIRIVNVDRRIAESAQRLVWNDRIRPKDSIHVATAINRDCVVLETFDRTLLKKTKKCQGLEIREPQLARQGTLAI